MTVFPGTDLPKTISGCVGWADFSDISTITSSAGSVSSVRNKANSQIPFIQGTGASQPVTGTRTSERLSLQRYLGNKWGIAVP